MRSSPVYALCHDCMKLFPPTFQTSIASNEFRNWATKELEELPEKQHVSWIHSSQLKESFDSGKGKAVLVYHVFINFLF